jgi:hypothetical protein
VFQLTVGLVLDITAPGSKITKYKKKTKFTDQQNAALGAAWRGGLRGTRTAVQQRQVQELADKTGLSRKVIQVVQGLVASEGGGYGKRGARACSGSLRARSRGKDQTQVWERCTRANFI